ncbi:increased loss of mitochondrial DNA protein 1 [Lipomyces arxii]|uniref:increased loss of mitochondrial DNA protein 1 n=1 Tax=Lipomyces arxii TaxID=56418 RepID=UPI0034CE763B
MVLLSSKNICLVHFALLNAVAYKLLTNPADISGHGTIFMIGRAMALPDAEFSEDDPALGLAAFLLLNLSIVDLTAMSITSTSFLELAVPLRLMLSFVVCGFGYMVPDSSIAIANSAVFSISFLDIMMQFWLYITIREERSLIIREQTVSE